MEKDEETPSPEYLHGFNTGYQFSKSFTDAGKKILEIYSSVKKDEATDEETSPIAGMIHGINQQTEELEKELGNERSNDLKTIRNQQGGEKEHDKER